MAYKEAVKKLRLKMLMTQEEFAKLLDVSFAAINRSICDSICFKYPNK